MPLRLVKAIPWATLRVRLTLLNTAVVLLATVAALAAVRVGARAVLYRESDAVLRGEVNEVAMALRDLHPDVDALVAELRRKATGHEERGWFTQLLTDDGTTIWKSTGCPDEVANWPVAREKIENLVQVGRYRFARRRITDPDDEPFHVRIGMPTAYLEDDIETLTRLLLPVGAALSLLTPLAGYWLALRATRPVADILTKAEQLKPTRLGDRLDVHGTRDELDNLSLTINKLLDEVAIHVDRHQQFVADAAHELRGPLAAIQNTLEVATSQERTPDFYRSTIVEVLEETRNLSSLVNDLLLLAEETPGEKVHHQRSVDLGLIAGQAAAMFAGVAEDRSVELVVDAGQQAIVRGDEGRLRQVVVNLIDNALNFTPPGGSIRVRVRREAGPVAVLRVQDSGCGIAKEHLGRVFDRFFQADPSRNRASGARGGGLGLSICRSIVEAHGGTIDLTSEVGRGTTFVVTLPADSPASAAPPADQCSM